MVADPERAGALEELAAIGLKNQYLVIIGVFAGSRSGT